MEKPTCNSCASFHKIDDTCHFNPPTAAILMVMAEDQKSFSPQTFCAFPTTHKHNWCRQHEEASRVLTLSH